MRVGGSSPKKSGRTGGVGGSMSSLRTRKGFRLGTDTAGPELLLAATRFELESSPLVGPLNADSFVFAGETSSSSEEKRPLAARSKEVYPTP